jgi:hypothetical protein
MNSENINKQNESEIEFNYIKSNSFRVVHADGAMGNGTPRGNLFLVFYSERFPLPDSQTFGINDNGKIISEVFDKRKVNSNGVMREVEIGVMLDINVAKGMVFSLTELIRQLESDEIQTEEIKETKE